VHAEITSIFDLASELAAYDGEAAATRVVRLCGESDVPVRVRTGGGSSSPMGPQRVATLLDLLRDCEAADGGILHDLRDALGLRYVTRRRLYSQAACLALDYDTPGISSMEPTDDDQQVRNDVTVSRTGGASARAVLQTGDLCVLDPPDGIGRYDESTTVNVSSDAVLAWHAGWRLHLGTTDEARYPVIGLDLAASGFAAVPAATTAARSLDIGDRLTVANPPAWVPPDAITQLVQGAQETLGVYDHDLAVNCSPESPWHVAVFGTARYDSDQSTIASPITSTDTSMSVGVDTVLWTTDAGSLPFDVRVAGEVMTVTAVTGATSPQTFTVTRSVNGVVKAHGAGEPVRLATPAYYGL